MTFEQKTFRIFYKKLFALYPKVFREQFGESMEQTFNDLCRERKQTSGQGLFGFVLWMFSEITIAIIKERLILIKKEKPMGNIITKYKLATIISFLVVLPFMILDFLSLIHI